MKNTLFILLSFSIFVFAACNPKQKKSEQAVYSLEKIWETDSLLNTSESALYDSTRDVIYVSCINGDPRTHDGQGYIAKISTDGKILDRYWITGLDAPKGLGLYRNTLFAADIGDLIVIDIVNDSIRERLPVYNAGMLNDVTVAQNGRVYFSDMDSGIIYTMLDGEVNLFLNDNLNRPNGLLDQQDHLMMASMGEGALYSIDFDSMQKDKLVDGLNGADGIIEVDQDTYLVSDWNGEIFIITPDGKKASLLNTQSQNINSADLGFIPGKNIVLVPTFSHNTVAAYFLIKK